MAEQGQVAKDLFGTDLHGMTDGNPAAFEDGSILTERISNSLIGEMMRILLEMGETPDENDYTQVWTALNKFGAGDFGDGDAGDVVINAPAGLNSDTTVDNLTIQNGGSLKTNGFKLFVRGTLQIDAGGVISNVGSDGGAGEFGGVSGDGGPAGSLAGGKAGGAGKDVAPGDPGAASVFGVGGDGGTGGDGDGGTVGGSGGLVTAPPDDAGTYRTLEFARTGELRGAGAQGFVEGGGGGGGGGGDGLGVLRGGGGGGGGGVVVIWANKLINDGLIDASGGDGGVGQLKAGGGGGGGGGVVVIVTRRSSGSGSIDVSGGTGGVSETTGDPGVDGADGIVIQLTA